MRDVESVSCDVVNDTVYIYDQNGNTVNILSIPGLENAYSTGRCIIAETETMSYTYKVRRDGSLGLPGIRGRVRAPDPPSDDLIAKVSNRTEDDCGSSRGYTPSRSYGGGGNGSPGCWFAFIIFAILYCVIYQKGCSNVDSDRRTVAARHEHTGVRKDLKEFIAKHDACRIVAITKTKKGGDVAIVGDNGYAYTAKCPSGLKKALKEIRDEGHKITDVCLTDKGKWVVLFGKNGWSGSGLPNALANKLHEYHEDDEALYSATFNDAGDWVVVSDMHYNSSSSDIADWLKDGERKYGELLSVSLTDDAQAAVFANGWRLRGKYPKELLEALKETKLNVRVIRMAGTSWFFADETGAHYHYHM